MKHVLLVDEDGWAIALMSRVLRDAGLFVSVARSALAARGILDVVRPDLLIVDAGLPDELARYARAQGIATYAIAAKGFSRGSSQILRQLQNLIRAESAPTVSPEH